MQASTLLEHLQVLLLLAELSLLGNLILDFILECFELNQGFRCEVLRRWFVLLHALQVFDDVLSLQLLLVNDCL